MSNPLLSRAPRELLARFFKRESRRLERISGAATSAAEDASPSTSTASTSTSKSTAPPSTQLAWTAKTNPFLPTIERRQGQRLRYKSARYSPRRQKLLFRAMEIAKLHEAAFGMVPGTSTSVGGSGLEGQPDDEAAQAGTAFALPEHWKLPYSPRGSEMPTNFASSSSQDSSNNGMPESIKRAAEKQARRVASGHGHENDPTKRGPYKGRRGPAFKLHKWERDRESILKERKAKLDAMPERLEEYTKARAAARNAAKPALPF